MNILNLYIIGNGFDAHHGIKCSYSDFHNWLMANCYGYDEEIEDFFIDKNGLIVDLWSSFEQNLAFFDYNAFARHVTNENPPDVTSEHFERTLSDARCEVENKMSEWTRTVRLGLSKWLLQLNNPDCAKRLKINNSESYFITFNYTHTLEDFYGVPAQSVLHLHGEVGCDANSLLLGHGGLGEHKRYDEYFVGDDIDGTDLMAGNDAANSAYDEMRKWQKPVSSTIKKHERVFDTLKDVENVYVLGYSFSEIDQPYIDKLRSVLRPTVKWTVSWYTNTDVKNIHAALEDPILIRLTQLQIDSVDNL